MFILLMFLWVKCLYRYSLLEANMKSKIKKHLDVQAKVAELEADKKVRQKRRTWGRSCLIKFRGELYELRRAGATLSLLQLWLKTEKHIVVERSTILRFLGKQSVGC
jgi:hypothetical protein